MKNKIIFKPVTEHDFPEILKLEAESFNSFDRLDKETLIELFAEYSQGFYIILSDGELAGYSVFLIENGAGYIESIAIKDNYRGHGLGLLALRFMTQCILDLAIDEINLHVRIDNEAAISLYEKEGFVKREIVDSFYKDSEPAYLYSKKVNSHEQKLNAVS